MASTGLDLRTMANVHSIHNNEKNEEPGMDETPIAYGVEDELRASSPNSDESNIPLFDSTHRKLKPSHIQLIGIEGTIGTALYVHFGALKSHQQHLKVAKCENGSWACPR